MYLKIGNCVIFTLIYQLPERKQKRFHVHKCPCETVGAKIGYVLELPVHDNVVVEFGRKVTLVDCLL